MFQKMLVLGPTRFTPDTKAAFLNCAATVEYDAQVPPYSAALARRIGSADALLVALEVKVTREAIDACPRLRYIGMCCSLYSPDSANVDILAAQERGIVVKGIRDYGDEGVVEFIVSELVQLLHGFGGTMWRPLPTELLGQKVGILGMGTLGRRIGFALNYFGCEVRYFSRTRKADVEEAGIAYLTKEALLKNCDIVVGCLNKNAILMGKDEFALFGREKILMNISIGPFFEIDALSAWLGDSSNFFVCDLPRAIGSEGLCRLPNVICPRLESGFSIQTIGRYNKKILENVQNYLWERCE